MNFDPSQCRNESEVESKLIVHYLLPKLGYTPDTWHQEVSFGNVRLDFLAFATQVLPFVVDDKSPLSVVLEAKHPREKLDYHTRKLRRYLVSLNVRYGVLTNGKELRIYEQTQDEIILRFHCLGEEIERKIEEIKRLIGRDSLKPQPLPKASVSPPKIESVPVPIETPLPRQPERKNNVKIIAVYHNKGGVGKTTTVVNLAAALRKKGKSVLVIDLDSQANTTFATGLVKFQFEEDDNLKESNVYHVLESGSFYMIPDVARSSDRFNTPEIDVIPSHISLIEGQYKLNQMQPSKTRLIQKLQAVEDNYDIVLLDTPPSRDIYASVALIAADYLIIPSDLKPFANQGLTSVKNFISEINEFRGMLKKDKINLLGVLPSKISTNFKFLEHTFPRQRQVIPDRYNLPLMDTVIYERSALSECMNNTVVSGNLALPEPQSVLEFADVKGSKSAQTSAMEFEVLADEVLQKVGLN
ncbi:MAG: AAA family ATPase [Spirulinaceae cyanobacterium]